MYGIHQTILLALTESNALQADELDHVDIELYDEFMGVFLLGEIESIQENLIIPQGITCSVMMKSGSFIIVKEPIMQMVHTWQEFRQASIRDTLLNNLQ